jgi:hypothetical protein
MSNSGAKGLEMNAYNITNGVNPTFNPDSIINGLLLMGNYRE